MGSGGDEVGVKEYNSLICHLEQGTRRDFLREVIYRKRFLSTFEMTHVK